WTVRTWFTCRTSASSVMRPRPGWAGVGTDKDATAKIARSVKSFLVIGTYSPCARAPGGEVPPGCAAPRRLPRGEVRRGERAAASAGARFCGWLESSRRSRLGSAPRAPRARRPARGLGARPAAAGWLLLLAAAAAVDLDAAALVALEHV